jgi:serine phosphatase RsbU (regulator of sigma subunit)
MLARMSVEPRPGARGDALARSEAFRQASLQSEIRRAYAVIGVAGLLILLVIRSGAQGDMDPRLAIIAFAAIGILLALQMAVLLMARWARRRRRMIPMWFIVASVVIEALIPAGIMLHHIVHGTIPPYAALSSPPLLVFAIMIGLTTLRLRPWLCILAGGVASIAYGGLLFHVVERLDIPRPTTGLPIEAYTSSAILILISGLAAAWVAHEIRRHLEAALGEAEMRRQMDLIEQDLSVARSIQQALLPREAPSIDGFEVAGWNRPADQTGGDYYDWQRMPDGTWIVTLADVSGHGIGPAMVTAACRAYVRASSGLHADLGSLTSRINRLLAEDLPEGRFITMVSVLIAPRQDRVALLSAGQSPIVLYIGATGAVQDILPQDMPLAVMADQSFGPPQSIAMAPGDVLALVTDGFVEWSRSGDHGRREQFGLDRLRNALRQHAGLPASAMIKAITAEVSAFAGQERQQDDLTMVVIRRQNAALGHTQHGP